ncbi:MAG: glycosyltransferase family 2 protein [Planctomycetes bacterium]|nr:glycosyltransferase family 2 protein [Planctomycetota bacterium]
MRCVALVPAYQNLATLPGILDELAHAGLPILVVDDGSTDGSAQWVGQWCRKGENRWMISLEANGGKGAALAEGLKEAARRDFEAALTLDADGQHKVADAVRLLSECKPGQVMLGARDETMAGYPATSLFGRRLWSLGIRALTGLGMSDPVCGMRVYPLPRSAKIECFSGHFAWEEEFLVRAARLGVLIDERPIATVYLPKQSRVSHYSLTRDWGESLAVFAGLMIECLVLAMPLRGKDQPLRRRDMSFRRIVGCAAFVGGMCGLWFPMWFAVPLAAWIAWKLHACWPAAAGCAIAFALLFGSLPTWLLTGSVVMVAFALTQAARLLDRS